MVDTCSYDWGFLSSEEFSDESFSDGSDGDDFEEATSSSLRVHYTTEAMDSLVPGLDPSDYGQMPATFYSNSQKIASTTIATDVVEKTGLIRELKSMINSTVKLSGTPYYQEINTMESIPTMRLMKKI